MPSNIAYIRSNEQVAENVRKLVVETPQTGRAGQFFMLRSENSAVFLPRAISLCDRLEGALVFMVQIAGAGTRELCGLRPGDRLRVTGPLGNGFPVDSISGKIALVGGGIGAAPMLLTAKELKESGVVADCFLGFRDEPFLHKELEPYCGSLLYSTESGRAGHKGLVTELFKPEDYGAVLCCGPEPMMKAVVALCQSAGTPVYVSLETKMACGVGGCLVCACAGRDGKNRRTCKDGPVFRGEDIDFDA